MMTFEEIVSECCFCIYKQQDNCQYETGNCPSETIELRVDKMGRIKEVFHENFHGILSHDGTLKVAKSEILQPILNIDKRNVLVKGKKNSYVAEIHKDLYTFMIFVDKGDYAFIKWRKGKAWMVGFQKKKSHDENIQDKYLTENGNCDWQSFLEGVDVE